MFQTSSFSFRHFPASHVLDVSTEAAPTIRYLHLLLLLPENCKPKDVKLPVVNHMYGMKPIEKPEQNSHRSHVSVLLNCFGGLL